MASIDFISGVALVIGALWLGWAARPSATGPVRRFAMMRLVEEYFVILLLAAIMAGAVLIAVAFGVA